MRVQIVTDAWVPQVNGVVRTLQAMRTELEKLGHQVSFIEPGGFLSLPCPSYPEIRLALGRSKVLGARIREFAPDAIHIATEGPLGLAARAWCIANDFPFTTAYHTRFPDYLSVRTGVPAAWIWHYIRWFHGRSQAVLISTRSLQVELEAQGIRNCRLWGRGVDTQCFAPRFDRTTLYEGLARPIQLFVGRVAVEKNIEAFLETSYPGTKVIVGDGPARAALTARYPDAVFLGAKSGDELAAAYAGADVFVFPSRSDTFGLVMIEALACGTPVAAYPVAGPADILVPEVACMDEDLETAIAGALSRNRIACARFGQRYDWARSAREFLNALVPLTEHAVAA